MQKYGLYDGWWSRGGGQRPVKEEDEDGQKYNAPNPGEDGVGAILRAGPWQLTNPTAMASTMYVENISKTKARRDEYYVAQVLTDTDCTLAGGERYSLYILQYGPYLYLGIVVYYST